MNRQAIGVIMILAGTIGLSASVGSLCYDKGQEKARREIGTILRDIVIDAQQKELKKLERAK